jgi:hypothetical protein
LNRQNENKKIRRDFHHGISLERRFFMVLRPIILATHRTFQKLFPPRPGNDTRKGVVVGRFEL